MAKQQKLQHDINPDFIAPIAANISNSFWANHNLTKVIQTKFGNVEVDNTRIMYFQRGVIGFEEYQTFYMVKFPIENTIGMVLLQSCDSSELSFMIIPLWYGGFEDENDLPFYTKSDLIAVASDLNIPLDDLYIASIVCITRDNNRSRISINLKAPLFMDKKRMLAYQHVFVADYPIEHFLS